MQKLEMKFLPDEPLEKLAQDMLGFEKFVKLLRDAIQQTQPPFVFGVLGDWGVGKTSILRMLEFEFRFNANHQHIVPIWFNAWEYDTEELIMQPLLYTIAQQYQEDIEGEDANRIPKELSDRFARIFKTTLKTSTYALSDIGLRTATNWLVGTPVKLDDLEKRVQKFSDANDHIIEKSLSRWVSSINELKQNFSDLLAEYAKGIAHLHGVDETSIRFLILIDDLDRCLPNTTIHILESIKNYLMVDNTVFMLGLNPQVVYQGIQHKYAGLEINGREYLEKILNFTFYVPEPDHRLIQSYATERIKDLIEKQSYDAYKPQFDIFTDVLRECRFNNPRKIIRIVNRYLLFLGLHASELEDYHMPDIVRLFIMAEYFPDVFALYLEYGVEVNQKLQALLNNREQISEFQKYYNVNLSKQFSTMIRMKHLFDLIIESQRLNMSVQDVYELTRIV